MFALTFRIEVTLAESPEVNNTLKLGVRRQHRAELRRHKLALPSRMHRAGDCLLQGLVGQTGRTALPSGDGCRKNAKGTPEPKPQNLALRVK